VSAVHNSILGDQMFAYDKVELGTSSRINSKKDEILSMQI